MDLISVRAYWRRWVGAELKALLPGAIAGIMIGALMFRFLSDGFIKLIIGLVALCFAVHYLLVTRRQSTAR